MGILWQFYGKIAPIAPRMGVCGRIRAPLLYRREVLGAGSAIGSDGGFLAGAAGQDVPLQWCDATGRLVPELTVGSWLASALPF